MWSLRNVCIFVFSIVIGKLGVKKYHSNFAIPSKERLLISQLHVFGIYMLSAWKVSQCK